MQKNPDRSDAPYLPPRYRETVDAKKRRRLYKKILTLSVVVIAVAIVVLILSGPVIGLFKGKTPLGSNASVPRTTTTTFPISTTAIAVPTAGRQTAPAIDLAAAQTIAGNYVAGKSGAANLNLSSAAYQPLGTGAGQYTFVYNRVVQNIPCDVEGYTVVVDSVTGAVTQFGQRTFFPDASFAQVSDPRIPRYAATLAVTKTAENVYPASGSSIQIVSADLRWKDDISPGISPKPASIPVAWKIQFTDAALMANHSSPAVGWVDPQSGSIIELDYRH